MRYVYKPITEIPEFLNNLLTQQHIWLFNLYFKSECILVKCVDNFEEIMDNDIYFGGIGNGNIIYFFKEDNEIYYFLREIDMNTNTFLKYYKRFGSYKKTLDYLSL